MARATINYHPNPLCPNRSLRLDHILRAACLQEQIDTVENEAQSAKVRVSVRVENEAQSAKVRVRVSVRVENEAQ